MQAGTAGRRANRQTGRQAGRQACRHGGMQAGRPAGKHARLIEKLQSQCTLRENNNSIKMKTPGNPSKKHGQDANPMKIFEKTQSGC